MCADSIYFFTHTSKEKDTIFCFMSVTVRCINVKKTSFFFMQNIFKLFVEMWPGHVFHKCLLWLCGYALECVFRDVWRAALWFSGLYYLYGALVLSVWLRDPCRVFSVSSAQYRGKVYEVCSHLSHALHAGHVQQRYQGASYQSNNTFLVIVDGCFILWALCIVDADHNKMTWTK